MKLNAGCGLLCREGWVNLDITDMPGVDVVHDLNDPLPFPEDTFTEIVMSHIIEHLPNPLRVMENLWTVAAPDCEMELVVPYGGSDEAWYDQTHLRPYFPKSFDFFSQRAYTHTDYGYGGDWQIEGLVLEVWERFNGRFGTALEMLEHIMGHRNVCRNMIVTLRAVKPARPRELGPLVQIPTRFEFVVGEDM